MTITIISLYFPLSIESHEDARVSAMGMLRWIIRIWSLWVLNLLITHLIHKHTLKLSLDWQLTTTIFSKYSYVMSGVYEIQLRRVGVFSWQLRWMLNHLLSNVKFECLFTYYTLLFTWFTLKYLSTFHKILDTYKYKV